VLSMVGNSRSSNGVSLFLERRLERAMISAPSRQDLGASGHLQLELRLSRRVLEESITNSIKPLV